MSGCSQIEMSGSEIVLESVFHKERKADEHGSDSYESTRTGSIKSDGFSFERQSNTGRSGKAAGSQHPPGATNPTVDGVRG